jgi:hypothetical protein
VSSNLHGRRLATLIFVFSSKLTFLFFFNDSSGFESHEIFVSHQKSAELPDLVQSISLCGKSSFPFRRSCDPIKASKKIFIQKAFRYRQYILLIQGFRSVSTGHLEILLYHGTGKIRIESAY